jgi:xylan 1,4-beta-xylosidase
MLGMMKGKRVEVQDQRMYPVNSIIDSGIRKTPDIGALASGNTHSVAILLWNYHDADTVRITEQLNLIVSHIPATSLVITRYLVDDTHSNSYEVWKKLGSPQQPTSSQIAMLEKAGQLQTTGKQEKVKVEKGRVMLNASLKGQAVELLKLSW